MRCYVRRGDSGINCLLAIDKPLGLSSHDVVGRVRRALGERRVGHAGTLDPAASGVLVIGVGQGTRLLGMLTLDEKTYVARIKFGYETSTDDAEGEVTVVCDVPDRLRDEETARKIVSDLIGEQDQVPPAYSAISVNGRRSYERARSGEQVILEPRHVRIIDAQLLNLELEHDGSVVWEVYLHVSKGTYVRSIARDLGRSQGSAAHLVSLRRSASGWIGLERCLSLEELEASGPAVVPSSCLDPVIALGFPFRSLSGDELDDVTCGRKVAAGLCVCPDGTICEPQQSERVSLLRGNSLVGVWRRVGPELRCESNFPAGIVGVGGTR